MSGTGQSTSLSTNFTLVVTAHPPLAIINQPPYFVSDLTLDFSVFAGEGWEYQLPDSVDPQESPITVSAQLSTAVIFMTFSSGRLSILAGASTASNVGTYSIQVQLINDLGAASTFIIKIVISAVPITETDG